MSNPYFNHDTRLVPFSTARAEDVNDLFDGVATGFDQIEADLLEAETSATAQATLATTKAAEASASAAAALASEEAAEGWAIQAASVVADGVIDDAQTTALLTWSSTKIASYVIGNYSAEVIRVARTSNTEIGAANRGNLIDITSGTFTQTFAACAALGDGWFAYIHNSGSGDVTLNPSSAETIDGLTDFIMYPGEVRLIQCDGSALRSVVLNSFYKTFTASGDFIKPPGYKAFEGLLWGGGGSGGKSSATTNASGGGGGACHPFVIGSSELGASVAFVIAAGGLGVSSTSTNGEAGGNSSFHTVFSYGGGRGVTGNASTVTTGGGGGGVLGAGNTGVDAGGSTTGRGGLPAYELATNGFGGGSGGSGAKEAVYGGGGGGIGNTLNNTGPGGDSVYGGGGGGGVSITNASLTSDGGGSIHGGAGGDGSKQTSGLDGAAPGGGGGATKTGANSGAGARGELRIWGVI